MMRLIKLFFLLPAVCAASDLVQTFKNPSFSGVGASAHYLTIDEQERTRKKAIADDIEAKLNEIERDADNTTLAKFLRNIESRIFSQLSRDLVEALFNSETGGTGGSFDLDGNIIQFINTGDEIILTITDIDGGITEIRIPVGTFGICSTDDCGI